MFSSTYGYYVASASAGAGADAGAFELNHITLFLLLVANEFSLREREVLCSSNYLPSEGHGDLQGGLRDERSIKSHHIYVPNDLRPPFFALYYPHYRHIFVYPFFNTMPGRGSVSTVDERRKCSIIVYDDLLWNALGCRYVSSGVCGLL